MPVNSKERLPEAAEIIQKVNPETFRDPEGVTLKQLDFGLWYLEHAKQFKGAFLGILILVSTLTWGYYIYGMASYLIIGMKADDRLIAGMAENSGELHSVVATYAPQDIGIGASYIFPATEDRYDLAAQLANPNKAYAARFNYYFAAGGKATARKHGFLFPGEKKTFMSLGEGFGSRPTAASIQVEDFRWKRVPLFGPNAWERSAKEHLAFNITEKKFIPGYESSVSEKLMVNHVSFKIENASPYNYREVMLGILVYRFGTLAGVNQYALSDFMSGKAYDIRVSWPASLGNADTIEVEPEVDFLDVGVYKDFEADGPYKP